MPDSSVFSGIFVPTNYILDTANIYSIDVNSPEFKELLVRLYQDTNQIALAVNLKDTGIYFNLEMINGQTWFPNPALSSTTSTNPEPRTVFRKVIDFGALPNTVNKPVAHGITCTPATTFTRIYATASDTTGLTYIPIPYASPVLANNIEIFVDATYVNITTGSNRTNFNICYVILEWIQT